MSSRVQTSETTLSRSNGSTQHSPRDLSSHLLVVPVWMIRAQHALNGLAGRNPHVVGNRQPLNRRHFTQTLNHRIVGNVEWRQFKHFAHHEIALERYFRSFSGTKLCCVGPT